MAVRTEEIVKTIPEESSATFRCIFRDEDNSLVTPVSINWDLTALDGTVIAYNQSVAVPDSTTYITISGTLLRILDGEDRYGERLLTIRSVYNSTYGNSLTLNKQIKFKVQNLKLIGYPVEISIADAIFVSDYVEDVA